MTDQRSTIIAAASVLAVGAIAVANACSPEANQWAAPIVATSPAACALLPPESAEREVCDASVRLAQAIERLNREATPDEVPLEPEPEPSATPEPTTDAAAAPSG